MPRLVSRVLIVVLMFGHIELVAAGVLETIAQRYQCPLLPPPADLAKTEVAGQAAELTQLAERVAAGGPITDDIRDRASNDRDSIQQWEEKLRRAGGADNLARSLAANGLLVDVLVKVRDGIQLITALVNLSATLHDGRCPAKFAMLELAERGARNQLERDPHRVDLLLHVLQAKAALLVADQDYGAADPVFVEIDLLLETHVVFKERAKIRVATLINHAVLYRRLGRFDAAEKLAITALQQAEATFGTDSDEVAFALTELSVLYGNANVAFDIGPLHDRIVTNRLKLRGESSVDTALVLNNRAQYRRFAGDVRGADEDYRHAIRVVENAGLEMSAEMASLLSRYGGFLLATGRRQAAEAPLKRAIELVEKLPDVPAPRIAQIHHEYAQLRTADDPQQALWYFESAVRIRSRELGDHPFLAESNVGAAAAEVQLQRPDAALDYLRAAMAVYERWLAQESSGCHLDAPPNQPQITATAESTLVTAVSIARGLSGTQAADAAREVFKLLQIAKSTRASIAMAQAARRDSARPFVRSYQQLRDERCTIQARVHTLRGAGLDPQSSSDLRDSLQNLTTLEAKLQIAAGQLTPEELVLVNGVEPVLQLDPFGKQLAEGELLAIFFVGRDATIRMDVQNVAGKLVTGVHVDMTLSGAVLSQRIQTIRGTIRPQRTFAVAEARLLHDALFDGLVVQALSSVLIVPDGPLDRLPLGLLMDASNQWLADRWNMSTVPSVYSVVAMRSRRSNSRSTKFMGIGDPALKGPEISTVERQEITDFLKGGIRGSAQPIQPAAVHELGRLLWARAELEATAHVLGAPRRSLIMGPDATEERVRALDFSQVGIVSFATHAVIAHGRLDLAEPALILTPIAATSTTADGVLKASDIAQLHLDSVWLATLSACDTAAGDTSTAAQGL